MNKAFLKLGSNSHPDPSNSISTFEPWKRAEQPCTALGNLRCNFNHAFLNVNYHRAYLFLIYVLVWIDGNCNVQARQSRLAERNGNATSFGDLHDRRFQSRLNLTKNT